MFLAVSIQDCVFSIMYFAIKIHFCIRKGMILKLCLALLFLVDLH